MEHKRTFEEAMERLQAIVEKLESGEEPLESSLRLFEEGARLSGECYEMLSKAEQRITEFTQLKKGTEEGNEQ